MKQKTILQIFGDKIKNERIKRNLSQEKFAELTGFHRTYIGMVERAERNITLTNIEKFADALEIDLKTLFTFDETKK